VVVIGGGLTGCVTASVLAAGGLDVMLVEADRLAGGATAGGLGVVVPGPAASYRAVEAAIGRRLARVAWKAVRRSSREYVTALRKLPTKSDLAPVPLLINSHSIEQTALLRREQSSRKDVGFEAPWLAAQAARTELGTESTGAIRLQDAALYDPVRATLGFANEAVERGARIFERSPVKRTKFTRKEAEVVLENGTVRTYGIVVATGEPGAIASQLRRHVRRSTGYAVVTRPLTAPMRRETGERRSILTEAGESPHWVRWLSEDRALIGGALSRPLHVRQREKALVQRTAQLMYEFALLYPVIAGLPAQWSWDVPIVTTADGMPWIGTHRNYPFHFFAFGFGWHGDPLAWLAARAALRHFRGESRREDEVFGFARLGS
jgi:glycine/D-amino acid oxidase-like deaminating enzyme